VPPAWLTERSSTGIALRANTLIPVAIWREAIHSAFVGEGIFVQRFRNAGEERAILLRLAGLTRSKSGNRDTRTMGRGIASWLQSAVGRRSQAIDISAGN
jgi:hypothetical protein